MHAHALQQAQDGRVVARHDGAADLEQDARRVCEPADVRCGAREAGGRRGLQRGNGGVQGVRHGGLATWRARGFSMALPGAGAVLGERANG